MAKTLGTVDVPAQGPRAQDTAESPPVSGGALSSEGLGQVRKQKGPPPVHLWNPPFCGDIDMVIRRDGTWWHEGSPIGRQPLVNLFASILKREGEDYFLVTPVEKVGIRVEDTPFVAVDVDRAADGFIFTTNTGDRVAAGPENAVVVGVGAQGAPDPRVHVRRGLWARIDRKTFYRLVEAAEEHDGVTGISAGGQFFPLEGPQDR